MSTAPRRQGSHNVYVSLHMYMHTQIHIYLDLTIFDRIFSHNFFSLSRIPSYVLCHIFTRIFFLEVVPYFSLFSKQKFGREFFSCNFVRKKTHSYFFAKKSVFRKRYLFQGCQIFLGTTYKITIKYNKWQFYITDCHKIYQVSIKYNRSP
jgi:hypothetical protein